MADYHDRVLVSVDRPFKDYNPDRYDATYGAIPGDFSNVRRDRSPPLSQRGKTSNNEGIHQNDYEKTQDGFVRMG